MEMSKLSKCNEVKLEQETLPLRDYQTVEAKDIECNGEIVK